MTDLIETARENATDAANHLMALQRDDGHIVYELEADATIPAEYIFLNHFINDLEPELEAEMGDYLRSIQSDSHGGWPLFYDGDFNISASVKAYYALKIIGDDINAPHMVRAREAILNFGGAEKANVFTRYALALFGQVPWHGVPVMPVELMLMPRWFPVNIWKFAYWSRTVIGPLLILASKRPLAKNPRQIDCPELFKTPVGQIKIWNTNPTGTRWGDFFILLDKVLQPLEKHVLPRLPFRKWAVRRAIDFINPRLNGFEGLGAIFPAMANTVMAFHVLGYDKEHPDYVVALGAVRKLVVEAADKRNGRARYCQPCVSPIWDTSLAAHSLLEAGVERTDKQLVAACDWLAKEQILDVKGDWAKNAPNLRPGGWAFQYKNDYYPDVDDTAVVGMLLHRVDPEKYSENIKRAAEWVIGMQSTNGGWGAFDIDNDTDFLNSIPFADHGALLDPPTVDVAARCLSFLAQIGHDKNDPAIARGIEYLKNEQEEDGSWFGRWGTNYIYGTWSALCAINAVGEDMKAPWVQRSVDWLKSRQREDGGWGEDGATYWDDRKGEVKTSTPSQTAWALLALMAAGEVDEPQVDKGISYINNQPRDGEKWQEEAYTAVGFPRVFYLRYHGYSAFFPTWALGRYANLKRGNSRSVEWGM